jgi:general secretion pathway protein J
VVNFIRHTLEQAYPLSWKVDGEDTLAFSGQNEALSFVGPVSSREGLSGNHLITLKLVEGDSGSDLVMQWHLPDPQEHGFDLLAESKPKILVRQVRAMTLDYFGADNDVNEPSWHAQWPSTQQLPRLIRLRLELENSEAWPDIVVAPLRAGERATPGNPPVQGEPQFGPLPG